MAFVRIDWFSPRWGISERATPATGLSLHTRSSSRYLSKVVMSTSYVGNYVDMLIATAGPGIWSIINMVRPKICFLRDCVDDRNSHGPDNTHMLNIVIRHCWKIYFHLLAGDQKIQNILKKYTLLPKDPPDPSPNFFQIIKLKNQLGSSRWVCYDFLHKNRWNLALKQNITFTNTS